MQIVLTNLGKRYNREWIFRNLSYTFTAGNSYAITGANGSGKSTLLQVIAGALTHTEGTVELTANLPTGQAGDKQPTANGQLYSYIAIAAPYLELVEEMTATEMLSFHQNFKKLTAPVAEVLKTVALENAAHKQIRYYSSGMKQRLKLAQAFFSNVPILLLDEPTTNLDEEGIALYHYLISNNAAGKLIIVSSNDKQEYDFCTETIAIGDYK